MIPLGGQGALYSDLAVALVWAIVHAGWIAPLALVLYGAWRWNRRAVR